MKLEIQQPELALETGQVITLDDAEGFRILARSGAVWITEEGNGKDHIVRPGDVLTVALPGRTVVQALQPSWISIGEGAAAANEPGYPLDGQDIDDIRFAIRGRYY